jgi:hypothetical protein
VKTLLFAIAFLALTACGSDGLNGKNGAEGPRGIQGPTGQRGPLGPQGIPGLPGLNGAAGIPGEDGEPGINGADGTNGQDSIIEVIDPCGKQSDTDEVFFRLSDGLVYAVYADVKGSKIHLVQLIPGNWVTTDQTGCYFTFNADQTLSNEHN